MKDDVIIVLLYPTVLIQMVNLPSLHLPYHSSYVATTGNIYPVYTGRFKLIKYRFLPLSGLTDASVNAL